MPYCTYSESFAKIYSKTNILLLFVWKLFQCDGFLLYSIVSTDKKEKKIFLIYKEIQTGAVANSYITNGLFIYD